MRDLTVFIFIVFAVILSLIGGEVVAPKHGQRVVCYMASWGVWLPGNGKFDLPDAEPALHMCTHLVYLFALLDKETLKIRPQDYNRDAVGIPQTAEMKKKFPYLRTMICLGGWEDGSAQYSRMARNEDSRAAFIQSAVKFLKDYNLDGLDLNWQFPGERGGAPDDKKNIVTLVKELREEFDKHSLIISVAVSSMPDRINSGIDGKGLASHAHFLNVLSYEYHGFWEAKVGPATPLNSTDQLSLTKSIDRYLSMGVPPHKINLGISSYGMNFLLLDPNTDIENIIGAPSKTYGFRGAYNGVDGFIAWNEVCLELDRGGWKEGWDEDSQTPYYINGEKVISIDNGESYIRKIQFAMEKRLGGIIYYGLEKDDFKGLCKESEGAFPTLRTIDRSLVQFPSLDYAEISSLLEQHRANYFWNGLKD